MKKFNFFPVLVVALFMFLGFESSAQTYKSIQESKIIVTDIVQNASAAENSPTSVNQTTASASDGIFRIKIGKSLLKHLNNNVPVVTALSNVTNEFSTFNQGGKAAAKNAVLTMYATALKN